MTDKQVITKLTGQLDQSLKLIKAHDPTEDLERWAYIAVEIESLLEAIRVWGETHE